MKKGERVGKVEKEMEEEEEGSVRKSKDEER